MKSSVVVPDSLVAIRRRLAPYSTVFGLTALFLASSIISPVFLTPTNLMNILRQMPILGFMALGMTLVIISGGIDLSVGGVLSLAAVGTAMLLPRLGALLTVPVIIAIGAVIGSLNGFIVSKWKLEPFVVTLGMQTVATGFSFMWSGGRTVIVNNIPDVVVALSNESVGPVPLSIVLMGGTYLVFWFWMRRSVFGRYIYALGGNEEVSYLSGVNVRLVRIVVFVISGSLSAVAGIFHFSRVLSGDPTAGGGIPLFVIASVIIGGTKFNGGRGSVALTIIGLLIIGIINNILNLLGATYYLQLIVQGVIIISAVLVSSRS
ncbi:MAG: ABC transporter permease [Bacillota bacterium]